MKKAFILIFSVFFCANMAAQKSQTRSEEPKEGLANNQHKTDTAYLGAKKKVDVIISKDTEEEVLEKPFEFAEVMPSYPGGDKELMKFLLDNLRYPVEDMEQGAQGRVVLRFVVGVDGTLTDMIVLKSLSPTADREAIRVVKAMPKWIPGRQCDKPVPVFFDLPVRFRSDFAIRSNISFSLKKRDIKFKGTLPSHAAAGTIVVNITVNPEGHVIDASIGEGTTVDDADCRKAALEAAQNAEFVSVKSKINQTGTITYQY